MDMQPKFLAVAFDKWTPAVQARFFRDVLNVQEWCRKNRRKLIVACNKTDPDFVLDSLGVPIVKDMALAGSWLVYYVQREPEVPESAQSVTIVHLPAAHESHDTLQESGIAQNPALSPEQGRDATHIDIIDRPSPNPYTPTAPSYQLAPMLVGS